MFDGAGDYGNEKEAGEGVSRAIKDGLVKREDLCEYMRPSPQLSSSLYLQSSRLRFAKHVHMLLNADAKIVQLWNTFHAREHVRALANHQLNLWVGEFSHDPRIEY